MTSKALPRLPAELIALIEQAKRNHHTHAEYREARAAIDAVVGYGICQESAGLRRATYCLAVVAVVQLVVSLLQHG